MSCPLAFSSGRQSMTPELAMTSKIPLREKPPLAPRSLWHLLFQGNKEHPARYHNKHRSEHARDGALSGSTQGEASGQTQSRDILRSKDKMKHLLSKTNIEEITDSERPSSVGSLDDFPGGSITVPHCTVGTPSSVSDGEAGDDLLDSNRETTFPRTVSRSSSAPAILTAQSRTSAFSDEASAESDGCRLTPLLEQTRQPLVAIIINRVKSSFIARTQRTHRHLQELQSSWLTSQTSLVSSPRTSCSQEESADMLQSSSGACGPSTSRQLHHLNLDDTMTFGDVEKLVHSRGRRAARGGDTATQNTRSLTERNKQAACRLKDSLSGELSNEEEDLCRICHSGDNLPTNPLVSPCLCSGSLQFIHLDCLKKWIQTKIQSGLVPHVVKRCELCMAVLKLDLDKFDLDDYCRRHREQEQVPITLLYNLEEAVRLAMFRSVHISVFASALMRYSSPSPRVQVWPRHVRFTETDDGIRERRSRSSDSSVT